MTRITLEVDDVFSVLGIHGNGWELQRGSYPKIVGIGDRSRPISDYTSRALRALARLPGT